jgi:hypothetical protein
MIIKITLALVVAFLINFSSYAQSFQAEKPVICANIKVLFEGLKEKYDEEPFWSGVGPENKFVLMVNTKTETWTIIEFNDITGCIVGEGHKANQIFSKPGV